MLESAASKATRRRLLLAVPLVCFVLLAANLYLDRHHLARLAQPLFVYDDVPNGVPAANATLPMANRTAYVKAIMDPTTMEPPRLECPQPDLSRYEYLKSTSAKGAEVPYFIALDLRDSLPLLPRLIGSVVEAIRFLGPKQCALSVIEGNSVDGTPEVLAALRPELDALTTTYYFRSSDINPKAGDRIEMLAQLRNLALQPLLQEPARYTVNTTIIFLNDVAICLEDILELVHQRHFLGADMTCAFDWTYVGRDPTFYDVWVARDLKGDTFFNIPSDGSWDWAWNLFWENPSTQARFQSHRPFQVFACWNGATTFSAAPIVEGKIVFRAPKEGECPQGEPQLFCKDMWFHGYGKIAVVPSVNLEYSNEAGKKIKDAKGYTSRWVGGQADDDIDWQLTAPENVKCMPTWGNQFWRPWNESLV